MTLNEAVRILNEHQHRGGDDWLVPDMHVEGPEPVRVVGSKIPMTLTAFEALAIAEKYASGASPQSVQEQVRAEGHDSSLD